MFSGCCAVSCGGEGNPNQGGQVFPPPHHPLSPEQHVADENTSKVLFIFIVTFHVYFPSKAGRNHEFFFLKQIFHRKEPNTLSYQQLVCASEPPASCHSVESEDTCQSPA